MNKGSIKSILVVDDDGVFRKRLAKALRDRGCEALEASNFNEAVAALEKSLVDAAVIDLRMPGPSGLELLRRLIEIHPLIRAVVLTGYGTIGTAVEALKCGAVNYLTKPVDADSVLDALFGLKSESKTQSIQAPALFQVEWDHIQKVVSDCGGNISQASKVLGLHRRSLQRKLNKAPGRLR